MVAFIATTIREYGAKDFPQLARVYKSAFAEPPWNEFMKCISCGVNYGKQEVLEAADTCKKCEEPLKLVKFWSNEDIAKDLEFALSQPKPIVFVAERDQLVGFTWGYFLPSKKFSFLQGLVPNNSNYMDEIAVDGNERQRGIGATLGKRYLFQAQQQGLDAVVLRTDERNIASMALFKKLGFWPVLDCQKSIVRDPEYPERVYLVASLNGGAK